MAEWIKRFISILTPPAAPVRLRCEKKLIQTVNSTPGRILDLGSGNRIICESAVRLDITDSSTITVRGDACKLPFMTGSFDLVVCSSVLEHVYDSNAAMQEAKRIVKRGGVLFFEVPFLFPFHTSSESDINDYTRWTSYGVDNLFDGFDIIEKGVGIGSGTALRLIAAETLGQVFLIGQRTGVYYLVRAWLSWILVPLSWLDNLIANKPALYSGRTAGGFYFIARKTQES